MPLAFAVSTRLYSIAFDSAPSLEFVVTQFLRLCSIEHNRNNWRSIDSIDGGITLGYYYSVTETAKANGASPFYYLKFLFERLPKLFKEHSGRPDPEDFDELMPWTDQYRSYEASAVASDHKALTRIGKTIRSKSTA